MILEPTITNSYSMDIIIKICGTLTTFIIFLFISAWLMTKRKFKFPHFIQTSHPVKSIKDLIDYNFLNICYNESKDKYNCGVIAAPAFDDKMAIVINDINWCFSEKQNQILSIPFSLTPQCIKKVWNGILFHRDSMDADVLRCLIVKGFESIDWSVLDKSIKFGLRYSDDAKINVDVSSQLMAFESIMGYYVDADKLETKLIFITKIAALIEEFSNYFYHGKMLLDDSSNPSEFVETVNHLMQPVIESAIYHSDSIYSSTIPLNATSENVLSQVAKLRHHLREENVNCNILTVDHFSHVLFEHYFVLNQLTSQCLRAVEFLASNGSEIIDVLKKELIKEAGFNNCRNVKLTELHLEESTSLVYSKSVAQELMRILSLGIEFDLMLTERDDSIGNFDLKDRSIIVLNHFAFSRGKVFHVRNLNDSQVFRPARFIRYDPTERKYVFYNSEKLAAFQDQWHIVGLPRNYICRMLLLFLVKVVFPDFLLDTSHQMRATDMVQYDLIYDLNKEFEWTRVDLVAE